MSFLALGAKKGPAIMSQSVDAIILKCKQGKSLEVIIVSYKRVLKCAFIFYCFLLE